MADRIAELVVAITGDASGLNKGLSSLEGGLAQADKSTQRLAATSKGAWQAMDADFESGGARLGKLAVDWDKYAGKMGEAGKAATVGLTLPIAAAGAAAIKLASDMDETANKVEMTFGAQSQAVMDWSATSIQSMGLAQQSALDAAALFGDMGAGMGLAAAQGYEMATSLVQLSADMASFKNVSQERAQTALAGIYTGETESLKGLGIVMTQANLQQFAATQGIKENVSEMTQAQQVQLRYQYVMQQTATAQGDFARTGGGAANQSRMLKEQVKQLGVSFGQQLLPAATKVLNWANNLLKGFNSLSPSAKKVVTVFALTAAAIGPLLTAGSKMIKTFQLVKGVLDGTKFTQYILGLTGASTAQTAAGVTAAAATPPTAGLSVAFNSLVWPITLLISLLALLIPSLRNMVSANQDAASATDDMAASLDEQAGSLDGAAQSAEKGASTFAELASQNAQLKGTLDDTAQSTDGLAVELKDVGEGARIFQDALGVMLFKADDTQSALKNVKGTMGDFKQALIDSKREALNWQVFELLTSGLPPEEVAGQINTIVTEFNHWETGLEGTAKQVEGFLEQVGKGKQITAEQAESAMSAAGALGEYGAQFGNATQTMGESMAYLGTEQALANEGTESYVNGLLRTAGILDNDMTAAYDGVVAAIAGYKQANTQDAEAYQAQIDSSNALIEQRGLERDSLVQLAQRVSDHYGQSIELSAKEEEALRNAGISVQNHRLTAEQATSDMYKNLLLKADGYTQDINQATIERDGLIENKDAIFKQNRVKNAEDLKTSLKNVTSGMSVEQINEFAKMAEQSGIKFDEGQLDILRNMATFGQDASQVSTENGTETFDSFIESFVREQDAALPGALRGVSDSFATWYGEMHGGSKQAGRDYMQGLASGIDGGYGAVNAAVRRLCRRVVADTKDNLGEASPSKIAKRSGLNWDEGLAGGVLAGMGPIRRNIARMTDTVKRLTASRLDQLPALDWRIRPSMSLPQLPSLGTARAWTAPRDAIQGMDGLPADRPALEADLVLDGETFGRLVARLADAGLGNQVTNTQRLGVTVV